jgi:hypothetical protein
VPGIKITGTVSPAGGHALQLMKPEPGDHNPGFCVFMR